MNASWFAILLFFGVLGGLVLLRLASKQKIEISNADILLALVPIALWLFLSGKVREFAFGDFKIVAAVQEAAAAPVAAQVSPLPVEKVTSREKESVFQIPRLIQQKTQALTFQLGREGYYYGPAIREYFDKLGVAGDLRYVLIEDGEHHFVGMFDAHELGKQLVTLGDDKFAGWLNHGDRAALQNMPGFVPAIGESTDKRDALERMQQLDKQWLPVIGGQGDFRGIVDRSKLTASMLIEIAQKVDAKAP